MAAMRFAVYLIFAACFTLTGCGSKGPLVLPPKEVRTPSNDDGSKAPPSRPSTDETGATASDPDAQ